MKPEVLRPRRAASRRAPARARRAPSRTAAGWCSGGGRGRVARGRERGPHDDGRLRSSPASRSRAGGGGGARGIAAGISSPRERPRARPRARSARRAGSLRAPSCPSEHHDAHDVQVDDGRVVDREAVAGQVDDVAVVGVGDALDAGRCSGLARARRAGFRAVRVARVGRRDEVRLRVGERRAERELDVLAGLPRGRRPTA